MSAAIISSRDISPRFERGGALRVLLSPRNVPTDSGFMGTLVLRSGEVFGLHYHPYSDEYLYVVSGSVTLFDGESDTNIESASGVFIARNTPHRLSNDGGEDALLVFFSTPLAPRPELGHVIIEQ